MLDRQSLREKIRRRLGASSVTVELAECDLDLAVEESLEELNRFSPLQGFAELTAATPAIKRYPIDHKNLIGIIDVRFMNPQQTNEELSENPFFNTQEGLIAPQAGQEGVLSEAYLTLGYVDDFRKFYSSDPIWDASWEVRADKREYALYIDLPESLPRYLVSYKYLFGRELSDNNLCGLPAITPNFEKWVFDYSVAASREILGEIRGKFGGINLPDGSQEQIDAQSQIDRGRQDKERLLDDLQNRQRQLPLIIA